MLIEPVRVKKEHSSLGKKRIQVSRLQRDGFLLVEGDPEVWIQRRLQSNPADLLSVRFLELKGAKKIGDSIGTLLSHLTHLSISSPNLKCLPTSISSLPNLQRLELIRCSQLQELPANLGDLNTLTFLSLERCYSMKSLPHSISKLSNLTSLHLIVCDSLKEFPANSNVVELILSECNSIQSLPKGLCNLKQLHLQFCESFTKLPTDLNILQLKIEYCCSIQSLPKVIPNLQQLHLPLCSKLSLANLIYFRSLYHLTFHTHCSPSARLEELPANLGELSELLTLNIQDTDIKWLPWSITKLPKLRLLLLPKRFRLETLPRHLNDSVMISVVHTHIRKTWKEIKTEIDLFCIPIVGVEPAHYPSTPGYLRYKADPGSWNQSNNLHSLVRILDLESRDHELDVILKLPELTHLHISHSNLHNVPLMLTRRLTHLSLFDCDFESCCDSLGKLSTLQSLTLLYCKNLPKHLHLPDSLTYFALDSYHSCNYILPDSYMASMRKLSKLKTLNLSGYRNLELSQLDFNLSKLKIIDCTIKSLPGCLQHLEIIHNKYLCDQGDGRLCYELQECLNQSVNMRTLSVTCSKIKVLPSIARYQTLQELQLNDCFNLRKFPSDLNELVELHTLNVSGTRIKSLPDSITKLQNLRHLVLPKCFIRKSLPKNIEDRVRVTIDDTDDLYYQHMGYYHSRYNSSEDSGITWESIEGGEEVLLQDFRHDNVIEQESAQILLKPQPIATQVDEGSHVNSRTVHIDNAFCSSQNLEMEILLTRNEACGLPLAPNSDHHEMDGHHFVSNMSLVHANPEELGDSPLNGLTESVGECSSHALCSLEIEETEILTVRNRDCVGTLANDSAAKSISNIREINFFSERNQHGFQNGRMNTIMEIEQGSEEYDATNSVCGGCDDRDLDIGQNHNPPSDNVKDNKTRKKEIPRDCILPLMSQNMRLVDAAKQLDVSSSTSKLILKKNELEWPSSRKRKQPQDAKSKKHNTKSRCVGKDSSLLDPANLAGHDLVGEIVDILDQLTLSDRLCDAPLEVNVAHESIRAVSRRIAQDPFVEPPSTMGARQSVKERSSVAEGGASLDSVQQPKSSSTFIVEANYNGNIIKFDLPLSSSIHQLKEELSKRLELDIGKIKMKYQDEENDWILIKLISDLEHALRFSGSNVLKLSITTSES